MAPARLLQMRSPSRAINEVAKRVGGGVNYRGYVLAGSGEGVVMLPLGHSTSTAHPSSATGAPSSLPLALAGETFLLSFDLCLSLWLG